MKIDIKKCRFALQVYQHGEMRNIIYFENEEEAQEFCDMMNYADKKTLLLNYKRFSIRELTGQARGALLRKYR